MNVNDTIAAVSTPRGKGGIAVIRISGEDAIAVASRAFLPKSGKPLSALESNRSTYGTIVAGGSEEIDDGMAVIFRAPHSFTGEDTVEISCHGGLLVTAEVLAAILAAGARAAEAGEFTRRAFLAGKLGLSEAEALGSLLDADTHGRLRLARSGLAGKLHAAVRAQYDRLCLVMSRLYAAIDYPDEEIDEPSRLQLTETLRGCRADILKLIDTYKSGRAILEGIPTVLCGKPNVGKSSLYNRLVGHDAAIVTSVAGTTRDILEATVPLGDLTLRLCDTAGLHDAGEDVVENIGMERAKEKLREAELILAVFDGSAPLDEADEALLAAPNEAGYRVALINKSDKPLLVDRARLGRHFSCVLEVSAETGEGLDALAQWIEGTYGTEGMTLGVDPVVANARQHAALLGAADALATAIAALAEGYSEDMIAEGVERAMQGLAEVDGRQVSEDIVSGIFSHFCVGK